MPADADVVHYQWLTLPGLDRQLLPKQPAKVWTAHGFLRATDYGGPAGLEASLRALERMDAVVALSEYGAGRLVEAGIAREKIEVIPHGAFDYLTDLPERPLPPELEGASGPVILLFGLIRPYKGADVLLRAFAEMDIDNAEVWIAGRPLGVDMAELRRQAERVGGHVRFVDRFVSDSEVPALDAPRGRRRAPLSRRRAVGRPLHGACVRQGDRRHVRRRLPRGRRGRGGRDDPARAARRPPGARRPRSAPS